MVWAVLRTRLWEAPAGGGGQDRGLEAGLEWEWKCGAQDVLMDGRGGGRGRGIQDASVRGGGGTAQGPGAEFCAGVAEGVSA